MAQILNKDKPLLILLDASNLICRAYFAMKSMGRNFSAPDGTPTSGLSTYLKTVESIRRRFPLAPLCALHEHPGGSFRDQLSESYKAHRPPMDPELKIQLGLAQNLLPLLGTPSLSVEGFEADDLLCAYSVYAQSQGWQVIMVTGDKDMGQVVSPDIFIINPADKDMNLMGPTEIEEKMGVPPELIVQFLALMGDAVDGIAGVTGVGPKTAAKLLLEHRSVEKILDNLDKMSPNQRLKFEEAKERLPLCIELAQARLDAPLPLTLPEIAQFKPDWHQALPELQRLAFKSWIAKAQNEIEHSVPTSKSIQPPTECPQLPQSHQARLPGF